MILRNLRRVERPDGPGMAADFTIADGRQGCVEVSLAEYQAHGEVALEMEAQFVVGQRMKDAYVAPRQDRYNELG